MKSIEVVAAIIEHNGKILCVQRKEHKFPYLSLKFEFPGGKIEPDETPEQALIREIREELSMDIFDLSEFTVVNHQYPDFNLHMKSYKCKAINAKYVLNEHANGNWYVLEEMNQLDWAAADLPILDDLLNE